MSSSPLAASTPRCTPPGRTTCTQRRTSRVSRKRRRVREVGLLQVSGLGRFDCWRVRALPGAICRQRSGLAALPPCRHPWLSGVIGGERVGLCCGFLGDRAGPPARWREACPQGRRRVGSADQVEVSARPGAESRARFGAADCGLRCQCQRAQRCPARGVGQPGSHHRQGCQERREKGRGPLWGGLFWLSGALDSPDRPRQPTMAKEETPPPVAPHPSPSTLEIFPLGGVSFDSKLAVSLNRCSPAVPGTTDVEKPSLERRSTPVGTEPAPRRRLEGDGQVGESPVGVGGHAHRPVVADLVVGESGQQLVEADPYLGAGQAGAQAAVDAEAEGHVRVGRASDVEATGGRARCTSGRRGGCRAAPSPPRPRGARRRPRGRCRAPPARRDGPRRSGGPAPGHCGPPARPRRPWADGRG